MERALDDGQADLTTRLGAHREHARARLWQGQVLVDWEADEVAGGCLLRPALVRRLLALHATLEAGSAHSIGLRADGRIVCALSPRHAQFAERLGPLPELRLRLRFEGPHGAYSGGEETYRVGGSVLLRVTAQVCPAPPGSARTSPAPS
jgi:hypothetical protein